MNLHLTASQLELGDEIANADSLVVTGKIEDARGQGTWIYYGIYSPSLGGYASYDASLLPTGETLEVIR
ncbi:MAG TPA: hypothetical protein VNN79_20805 [Actinomycetota bacterium]|nr:hypothetical protein [Actinomycetota bacterium]